MTLSILLFRVGIAAVILTLLTSFVFKKHKSWLMTFVQNYCGALFLFSGWVKAVDPLGTAYKLQDYFGEFESTFSETAISFIAPMFPFLSQYAVTFSVAKEHYQTYKPIFDKIVETMQVFSRIKNNADGLRLAGTKGEAVPGASGDFLDNESGLNDIGVNSQRKKGSGGSGDDMTLYIILAMVAGVGVFIAKNRKKKGKKKKGKKKMRSIGNVQVPQKAFLDVLKLDD